MLEVAIYSFYLAMGEKNPLEEKKLAEEAAEAAPEVVEVPHAEPEKAAEAEEKPEVTEE